MRNEDAFVLEEWVNCRLISKRTELAMRSGGVFLHDMSLRCMVVLPVLGDSLLSRRHVASDPGRKSVVHRCLLNASGEFPLVCRGKTL